MRRRSRQLQTAWRGLRKTKIGVVQSMRKCVTLLFTLARSSGFETSDAKIEIADLIFNTYVRMADFPHSFER